MDSDKLPSLFPIPDRVQLIDKLLDVSPEKPLAPYADACDAAYFCFQSGRRTGSLRQDGEDQM